VVTQGSISCISTILGGFARFKLGFKLGLDRMHETSWAQCTFISWVCATRAAHLKALAAFDKTIESGEWPPDTPALIKNEYTLAPDIVGGFDKSLAYYLHKCFVNSTLADELFKDVKGSGFKLLVAVEDRISEELHGPWTRRGRHLATSHRQTRRHPLQQGSARTAPTRVHQENA